MLEYLLVGIIAAFILLLYCFINVPSASIRILRGTLWIIKKFQKKDTRRKRVESIMEFFNEHRQSTISRNIVIQIIPWLGVLGLVFILTNQYIYFGTVLSGSMEPVFKRGDLVLMQTIDKKPEIGDIIMYTAVNYDQPITHRVVSINKFGIIKTKGDANIELDNWDITEEYIMGKTVTLRGNPLIIKGIGSLVVPEAGEFTIMNKLPRGMAATAIYQQIRAMAPILVFFSTIFYFFVLIESRLDNDKRFNGARRENNKSNPRKYIKY
jgi:signal peptidase